MLLIGILADSRFDSLDVDIILIPISLIGWM